MGNGNTREARGSGTEASDDEVPVRRGSYSEAKEYADGDGADRAVAVDRGVDRGARRARRARTVAKALEYAAADSDEDDFRSPGHVSGIGESPSLRAVAGALKTPASDHSFSPKDAPVRQRPPSKAAKYRDDAAAPQAAPRHDAAPRAARRGPAEPPRGGDVRQRPPPALAPRRSHGGAAGAAPPPLREAAGSVSAKKKKPSPPPPQPHPPAHAPTVRTKPAGAEGREAPLGAKPSLHFVATPPASAAPKTSPAAAPKAAVRDDDDDDLSSASDVSDEIYDWCAFDTAQGLSSAAATPTDPKPDPKPVDADAKADPKLAAVAEDDAFPRALRPRPSPPPTARHKQPAPPPRLQTSSIAPPPGVGAPRREGTPTRLGSAPRHHPTPPSMDGGRAMNPGASRPPSINPAAASGTPGGTPMSSRPGSSTALASSRRGSSSAIPGTPHSGTPHSGSMHSIPGVVKDTNEVTRKRASLPSELQHPMPTSGDFLKKRVIVNNYILLDSIGTGSYAEVRLCKEKQTDGLFAVKIINKELLQRRFAQPGGGTNKEAATMLDDVKREIAIMKKLSHPHVLRLYEVMDDPKVNKLYLVLEYMKRGDLMQLLNGNSKAYTCEPMSERALWHVFRQVGCGLEYLHLQNIVHGDIKPQNLLVGDDGVVKIADFGISKMISGDSSQARALVETSGTPAFMCPEICAGAAYQGFSADVWALGATMYMLRLGRPPFLADKVIQLYYKIIHDAVDYAAPEGQQALDAELRRLLGAMMTKDPLKRVDLAAVLADAWLRAAPRPSRPRSTPTPGLSTPTAAVTESIINAKIPAPPSTAHYAKIVISKADLGSAISAPTHHTPTAPRQRSGSAVLAPLGGDAFGGEDAFGEASPPRGKMSASDLERRTAAFTKRASNRLLQVSDDESDDGVLQDDEFNDENIMGTKTCKSQSDLDLFGERRSQPASPAHDNARLDISKVTGKAELTNPAAAVVAAWHSRRGQRPTQEDRVTVIPDLSALDVARPYLLRGMAYFGIFDGHGGHACATLLQHGLHTALACRADLHADGRAAAAAAFRKVDDDCCTSLRSSDDASGSTALVAVYDGRARQLVVAHAGDSRCVLCAGGGAAVALTSDHRLTRTDERARIEAAGGLIVNNRLNGTLAISRSFGDVAHKGGAGAPTVTATPEVTIRAIAADDEFVVLGSDGLWDALSNQSVVNFVRTELGAHHDLHKAAVSTTAEALRRGSVDNVSCIIVLFT